MTHDALAGRLKALADPVRLRILKLLPTDDRCEDVCNVSELARELGLAQPSVSHHLLLMKRAGLIRSRKMCRDVYYWIDVKQCARVLEQTKKLTTTHPATGAARPIAGRRPAGGLAG